MHVENRTIFENDNLHVLRSLDPDSIDLIYLDPPFNSNKTYEVPIGDEGLTEYGNLLSDGITRRTDIPET